MQGCGVLGKRNDSPVEAVDHALRTPATSSTAAGPVKGTGVGSKYEAVADLFEEGSRPLLERFDANVAMAGKCSFRYDPQEFYPGFLNVYVEDDQVLGKILFMVPIVQSETKSRGDGTYFMKLSPRALGNLFGSSKSEITYFTAAQDTLPPQTKLNEVFQSDQKGSLYFTYTPEAKARALKREAVGYRLRENRTQMLETLYVLEYYCPSLVGCRFTARGKEENYQFGAPYAYCYYSQMFRPVKQRSERIQAGEPAKVDRAPADDDNR